MDCREAQSLIVPFIENKLNDEQLEEFLYHIERCSECYDELEVYFIVLSGIRQLDGNEKDISDFKGELGRYIAIKKDELNKKRQHRFRVRLFTVLGSFLILCAAGIFAVSYTGEPEFLARFGGNIGRGFKEASGSVIDKSYLDSKDVSYSYFKRNTDVEKLIRKVEDSENGKENSAD